MEPDQDGLEPFDPTANPADTAPEFEDDDRDDDTVEDGAPDLGAPDLGVLAGGGPDA